ncbi:MAG: polyprenyl synthetase family protein [Candidatus Bathyarchaeota archaeon]|nr:polyprenyl synthetase family protein [Candidatus Bathyarchaeota archaeon]
MNKEKLGFINETLKELDLSHIHPVLKITTGYAISSGGKRLRPLITTLCAEMVGGDYREARDAFLALELIHNATLVHDDIIDEDLYRRGVPTVHIEYGVKKAVLTGDALLSMGLMYAARTGKPSIVNWLSETALKMVQGIAVQSQKKRQLMSVDEYLHMNYLKSGSLFEAAAALGGVVGSDEPSDIKRLSEFGKYFGNAYQIRDDIMDAFTQDGSDRSSTNDLLNGDISLLLIYALESEKATEEDKSKLLVLYRGESDILDVDEIRRIYEETGALEMSICKMKEYSDKAGMVLDGFSDCDAKASLMVLLEQYNSEFASQLQTVSVRVPEKMGA